MKVLISGGGIAGPALAHWLALYGMAVTVVERAPAPRPGGHAVDLRGAGREVSERMGILPAVREHRVDERGVALVDARGRHTAEMAADLFGGDGMVAEIEISRGDLARILYDLTRDRCDYRFGDRITALAEDAGGIDVTFASGGTERFDLVVGADGVHSGVRALAFGREEQFVQYLGGHSALFSVPDPGDLGNWFHMYNAPGGLVAGLRPERAGTAKASLSFIDPVPSYAGLTVPQQKQLVVDRMAGAGWKVPDLLAAVPSATDFYFDSIDRVHVPQWHRGRVVLLGDAGYCGSPLAGNGTSLAIVGAYVLAGELAEGNGPAAYQQEMAAYVAAGIALPPGGIGAFAPKSRAMIALRSLSWRSMNHWPMRPILTRQFARADAITLKDYAGAVSRSGR